MVGVSSSNDDVIINATKVDVVFKTVQGANRRIEDAEKRKKNAEEIIEGNFDAKNMDTARMKKERDEAPETIKKAQKECEKANEDIKKAQEYIRDALDPNVVPSSINDVITTAEKA